MVPFEICEGAVSFEACVAVSFRIRELRNGLMLQLPRIKSPKRSQKLSSEQQGVAQQPVNPNKSAALGYRREKMGLSKGESLKVNDMEKRKKQVSIFTLRHLLIESGYTGLSCTSTKAESQRTSCSLDNIDSRVLHYQSRNQTHFR